MSSGLNDVLQTQISDLSNFFKRRLDFLFARMLQADGKGIQNRFLFVQPRADDEGDAKFVAIGLVEVLKRGDFLRGELAQAGAGLLGGRGRSQGARQRGPTNKIGMSPNQ